MYSLKAAPFAGIAVFPSASPDIGRLAGLRRPPSLGKDAHLVDCDLQCWRIERPAKVKKHREELLALGVYLSRLVERLDERGERHTKVCRQSYESFETRQGHAALDLRHGVDRPLKALSQLLLRQPTFSS